MTMLQRLVQRLHQARLVLKMICWSALSWGWQRSLRFWMSSKSETILVGDRKFNVRGGSWSRKIADFAMLFEVNVLKAYDAIELRDTSVVIDIGSHIGGFAIRAASIAKQVVAVEAHPETFAILSSNISANAFHNVTAVNLAISGHSGQIELYVNESNPAENSLTRQSGSSISVNSTTLDDLMNRCGIVHCDVLKLDCEGAEYDILFSSRAALSRTSSIVMEYHEPRFFGVSLEHSPEQLGQWLESNGFDVEIKKQNRYQGILVAERRTGR